MVRKENAGAKAWFIFALLFCGYMLSYFHRFSPGAAADEIRVFFLIDSVGFGLVGAATYYAYALMQPLAGICADRLGGRLTLTLFLLLAGAGAAAFGLCPYFSGALAGRVLVGLGVGAVSVCAWKILADWFPGGMYVRVVGLFLMAGGFGSLLSFTPLVWLNALMGWRNASVFMGAATALLGAAIWIFLRDRPAGAFVPKNPPEPVLPSVFLVLRNPVFWKLGLWYASIPTILYTYNGLWAGPFMTEVHGLDETTVGSILSMTAPGIIIQLPLAAWLMERFNARWPVLVLSTGITGIMCLALVVFPGSLPVWALYGIAFCMTTGDCAAVAVISMLRDAMPPGLYGTASGLFNALLFLVAAVAQTLSGLLLGWARPHMEPSQAYGVAFGLLLVAACLGFASCWLFREMSGEGGHGRR